MRVTEMFISMQGEGVDTGLPTLFIRFTGCSMGCSFCDTDNSYNKGKEMSVHDVLGEVMNLTFDNELNNIVLTGGEPLEQDISELWQLVTTLSNKGYRMGIETNGSKGLGMLADFLDVISMSPKLGRDCLRIKSCTNLKILYPYIIDRDREVSPAAFRDIKAENKIIQPIYGTSYKEAFEEVKRLGDGWKLGVQLHKLLDME